MNAVILDYPPRTLATNIPTVLTDTRSQDIVAANEYIESLQLLQLNSYKSDDKPTFELLAVKNIGMQ